MEPPRAWNRTVPLFRTKCNLKGEVVFFYFSKDGVPEFRNNNKIDRVRIMSDCGAFA
jgi:hypothetical protein